MAQFPAYAVNGGKVQAEMLRTVAYAATNGANGVISFGDLKVTALPTPGASVRIAAGAALLKNRFSGTSATQTYVLSQDSQYTMSIPSAAGGARTDYIIARIDDWHYTGQSAPADPENALYWSFQRVSTLSGITYPYVPLASIALPSGASTVTNAMITDLREVANPRTESHMFVPQLAMGQTFTINTNTYTTVMTQEFDIPEWATVAVISADIGGLLISRTNQLCLGGFVAVFAGNGSAEMLTRIEADTKQRMTVIGGGEIPILPEKRGGTSNLAWRLRRTSGSGDMFIDANTSFRCSIQFKETAD
jgi:hypothetical protein